MPSLPFISTGEFRNKNVCTAKNILTCRQKGFLYFDIERENILSLFYIATGSLHKIWDSLLPKPKWYQSSKTYNDEAARVIDMGKALQERQQTLSCQQEQLHKQETQLEEQCATPEAKSYIALTTARILQKDLVNVTKSQKMETSLQNLQNRLGAILTMQAAIKAELLLEQPLKLHKENVGGASARRRMEDVAHSLVKQHTLAGVGLSVSLHQQDNHDFASMDDTEREAQSEIIL